MKLQLQPLPREHKGVTVVNKLSSTAGGHNPLRKKTKYKRKKIIRDKLKNSWSWPHFAAFGVSRKNLQEPKGNIETSNAAE